MCGILGTIGVDLSEEQALAALRTLRHRGPDGEGHWRQADPAVFLGHRRLAIVDLSDDGRQPMTNEDGTVVLTLNGEIYNHEELRKGLLARGHTFRGRCDAEVVLHLYEEKGMALLDDLRGMFAFAIWDATRRVAFLARDRIGIKPLVWYDDGDRLAFASELKGIRALAAAGGLELEPDPTAYYDYLTYEYVPAPKTIWKRVRKLPAGHWLEWTPAGARVTRWWDPPTGEHAPASEAELLAELDAAVSGSVRAHLMADVPVGVFLSAGVDSTLVSALAREDVEGRLQAFTVGFEGRDDDEAEEAAAIAGRLGMDHRLERFGLDELRAGIDLMPELFDEPFADASALPMIGLCRRTAEHVKVVLSGDGGDETHAGYGRYLKRPRKQAAYRAARSVPGLGTLSRLPALAAVPWARALREDALGAPYSFHMGIPREAKKLLLEGFEDTFADYDDYWAIREDAPHLGTLRGQQRMDLRTHLPEGILTKVDRTSMRFGLEVRPPLLDHALVELGLSLPDEAKVRGEQQKVLLRELLARHVPPSISGARKRAFSVPMKRFVKEGVVGPTRDIEVFDAFRVSRRKLQRHFGYSSDNQLHWILHGLQTFLDRELRA